MKKIILSIITLTFSAFASAQLKVYNNGKVTIGLESQDSESRFTVGSTNTYSLFPVTLETRTRGITGSVSAFSGYNFGVAGFSAPQQASVMGRTFGVYGMAANCSSGYNYGVYGYLGGSSNGAAVYGSASTCYGTNVNGRYAGYFQGPIVVTGTATINNINTPSDYRLKEDICYLGKDGAAQDILSRMMEVGVVSYKLKTMNLEAGDTAKTAPLRDDAVHYGVIAQELRDLFPDLVREGQDGYLAVNYVELVPMLICSLQEMNRELTELRAQAGKWCPGQESDADEPINGCVLGQNTPNPAKSQTVIKYRLPEGTDNAAIYILNLQGTLRKQVAVTPAQETVTVNCSDLEPGFYYYSLIVGGKEIDTKKMIVGK